MANWEKLDKEFYNVVNNLTDEQWQLWRKQQNNNRIIRQKQKEMEMKMHLLKLSFFTFKGKKYFSKDSIENTSISNIKNIEVVNNVNRIAKLDEYALAA